MNRLCYKLLECENCSLVVLTVWTSQTFILRYYEILFQARSIYPSAAHIAEYAYDKATQSVYFFRVCFLHHAKNGNEAVKIPQCRVTSMLWYERRWAWHPPDQNTYHLPLSHYPFSSLPFFEANFVPLECFAYCPSVGLAIAARMTLR